MADAPETTFGINALAQSLGRSIVSIRRLERNGVLPPATRVHGRRRYSAADIERMRRAAEETGFREHPDRLDAFRAALHAQEPEPLNIRDIAPPEAWADLEDREPQPQVRGWADMGGDEDGGDGWRPASPAAATRPACPACEGLVHQVTDQYQRLVWMCGRDGLVRRPLRDSSRFLPWPARLRGTSPGRVRSRPSSFPPHGECCRRHPGSKAAAEGCCWLSGAPGHGDQTDEMSYGYRLRLYQYNYNDDMYDEPQAPVSRSSLLDPEGSAGVQGHGLTGYRWRKCRCATCRQAKRQANRAYRQSRRLQRSGAGWR